jgi:hypothetical protein
MRIWTVWLVAVLSYTLLIHAAPGQSVQGIQAELDRLAKLRAAQAQKQTADQVAPTDAGVQDAAALQATPDDSFAAAYSKPSDWAKRTLTSHLDGTRTTLLYFHRDSADLGALLFGVTPGETLRFCEPRSVSAVRPTVRIVDPQKATFANWAELDATPSDFCSWALWYRNSSATDVSITLAHDLGSDELLVLSPAAAGIDWAAWSSPISTALVTRNPDGSTSFRLPGYPDPTPQPAPAPPQQPQVQPQQPIHPAPPRTLPEQVPSPAETETAFPYLIGGVLIALLAVAAYVARRRSRRALDPLGILSDEEIDEMRRSQ